MGKICHMAMNSSFLFIISSIKSIMCCLLHYFLAALVFFNNDGCNLLEHTCTFFMLRRTVSTIWLNLPHGLEHGGLQQH